MEPDDNTITFKSQLRHYLEASGMNASQLSRKSGVPRQTVANWLMGMTPKNITQIKKVADVFKVSLDQLLFGKADPEGPRGQSVPDISNRRFEIRIVREII